MDFCGDFVQIVCGLWATLRDFAKILWRFCRGFVEICVIFTRLCADCMWTSEELCEDYD